MIIISPGHRT